MDIQLKTLTEMSDLKEANQFIKKIWGEENGITPYLLTAHSHVGGLILGAYKNHQLIGASYGFPAMVHDSPKPFFYSHILGVMEGFRGKGIGESLKYFQAETAKEKGYEKMQWTFDPLESRNAYLNIHKLGATSNKYQRNFYGEMMDSLNSGTPTDRLFVEWNLLDLNKNVHSADLSEHTEIMDFHLRDREFPVCQGWVKTDDNWVRIAIPTQFQALKESSIELARQWRLQTKEAFTFYFNSGFSIVDFDYSRNRHVQYYLLHKNK